MPKNPSPLIVTEYQPWRRWALVAVLAAAMLGGGWGLYEQGRRQAGVDAGRLAAEYEQARARIEALEEENRTLRAEKARLERTAEVDRRAYAQVKDSLNGLQDQILELKEELAFYRSVMGAGDGPAGLRVQDLAIVPGVQDGLYHFRLTLTQVRKNDRAVSGEIGLAIDGVLDGTPRRLLWDDVASADAKPMRFRFRYFQTLEGDLLLPAGFVPTQVVVQLEPKSGARQRVERSFAWQTLIGAQVGSP